MRAFVLSLVLLSTWAAALRGQTPASPAPGKPSSGQDAPAPSEPVPNLPVSLDRIREALQNAPAEPLKGLDERPHFRVEIRERQRIEDLLSTMKFDSGPPIPGGLYAYEHQRLAFPPTSRPGSQPYAAYTQGELVQVLATSFLQRYYAGKVVGAISSAQRTRDEEAAREEARRAIQQYCAAQPRSGADIRICSPTGER
jgi:hypothetical protein